MKSKLQLLEVNDDHWTHDYDCALTMDEKITRLAERLENADFDLSVIYFVAMNVAYAGQPENLYVRAVLRIPNESDCGSFNPDQAVVSAEG